MRRTIGVGVFCFAAFAISGCNNRIEGPSPEISALDPQAVCNAQLTTAVTISGDAFSPLPVETLADEPALLLPTVVLTHATDLAGGAGSAAETGIPADEHVRWSDQQTLVFDVFPALALDAGLYDVSVTNPNGDANRVVARSENAARSRSHDDGTFCSFLSGQYSWHAGSSPGFSMLRAVEASFRHFSSASWLTK